jgi:hypothetical protein
MHFPGGLLIGCDAGTLNFAKIKGSHTAMKSGMLAAESVYRALIQTPDDKRDLADFAQAFHQSWLGEELRQSRNFGPLLHRFGTLTGGALNYIDQNWFKGKLPFTLHDRQADHLQLQTAEQSAPINYPKPDNQLSFDKPSSVYLANTSHDEDQPCHLRLKDPELSVRKRCRVLLNRPSVIARRGFMKSSPLPESLNCRLMRKTACTVKPATSKILCRISSGRCPKGQRPQLPEYVISSLPRQRRVFFIGVCFACVLPPSRHMPVTGKKSTPSGVPVLPGNRGLRQ